jgi:hypothetical protein
MLSTLQNQDSINREDSLAIILLLVLGCSLRIPFLSESLWVDELHSAWVVADSFAAIPHRAEMGNQTPLYYWALWLWRQAFGVSEWSFRFPSLLASLGSMVLLYRMVKHHSKCRKSAVLASALLACESNSIFFGSETRPYALIMFGSLVFVDLFDPARPSGLRTTLLVCLATMLTCLLHLSVLFVAMIGATSRWFWQFRSSREEPDRVRWVFVGIGLAGLLSIETVWEVWHRRQIWESLHPNSILDILDLFPWLPMIVFPGVVRLFRLGNTDSESRATVPLCFYVLAIVVGIFGISFSTGVGIWHRKYLISILPFLCWCSALLWIRATTDILFLTRLGRTPLWFGEGVRWGMLAVLLFYLTVPSDRFLRGNLRGEDWRSAIALINRNRTSGDSVRVAPSLFESKAIEATWDGAEGLAPDRWAYFSFPVNSVYLLSDARPLGEVFASNWRVESADLRKEGAWIGELQGTSMWIVARSTSLNLQSWYQARLVPALRTSPQFSTAVEIHDFGGVSVLRVPYANGN